MDNYDISSALGMYAKLSELHDENPFKVKAFSAAAFNLKKIKEPLSTMSEDQLAALQGVGKTVFGTLKLIIQTGTFPDLESIVAKTPPGILDMLRIKGLGPKKVQGIWRKMGLETVEELFDACRENRLVEQPGFGLKTQGEVMRAIEFSWNAKGKFHYARIEKPAQELLKMLKLEFPGALFEFTGEFRRFCEIIDKVDLITTANEAQIITAMSGSGYEQRNDVFVDASGFRFGFVYCTADEFKRRWFETSAVEAHLEQVGYSNQTPFEGELEFYKQQNLPYIEPEMREGLGEVEYARSGKNLDLVSFSDLKGILHNHSTYSDGLHSLREMATYCKELGYEYLGICDHSKSAGYAGGLQVEKVLEQHKEIDLLNAELAPFKIFKGIESDILADGSLDYDAEILAKFDLVVASIHSNLKMNEEKAMMRLLKAIENPYTTILGHPTGRLLLVREGYPIDHVKIIDACAANGVSLELNANPFRLDLDWRWIRYAMEKGVMIGINPDAHEKHGYYDMYFGSLAARKGGLTTTMTLNALSLVELEKWLNAKRLRTSVAQN